MTEFQTTNQEPTVPNREIRTLVQFSVFGLVKVNDGGILLLNQRNHDASIPAERSWRTPGGKVEVPPALENGVDGILSDTETPVDAVSTDLIRLVDTEKADQLVATVISKLDIGYLVNQCRRELVEEVNKAILRTISSDSAERDQISKDDTRLVREDDFMIKTHTPWIQASVPDPKYTINQNRMYFTVSLSSDEAKQKIAKLVGSQQAIWYDGTKTSVQNMPVSESARRALDISTLKDTFLSFDTESP